MTTEPELPPQIVCPNCNAPWPPGSVYCQNCGYRDKRAPHRPALTVGMVVLMVFVGFPLLWFGGICTVVLLSSGPGPHAGLRNYLVPETPTLIVSVLALLSGLAILVATIRAFRK